MAKLQFKPKIDVEINLIINEEEAKFLEFILSYDEKTTIELLNQLSPRLTEDTKKGFKSLKELRTILCGELERLKNARANYK